MEWNRKWDRSQWAAQQTQHTSRTCRGANWDKGSLTLAVSFLGTTFPIDGHDRLAFSLPNEEMQEEQTQETVADVLLQDYGINHKSNIWSWFWFAKSK